MSTVSTWREAVAIVGPVEAVRGPNLSFTLRILAWAGVALFIPVCYLSTLVIPPRNPALDTPHLPYLLLATYLVWLAVIISWIYSRLRWRLLVGANGFALWRPGQAVCVRWESLGREWVPSFQQPISSEATEPYALEHTDGTVVVLNSYFDQHRSVVRRIRRELAARAEGVRDFPGASAGRCYHEPDRSEFSP